MSTRSSQGTSARLRGLLADVLELVQVRLELASIEAREDLGQVLVLFVLALLALLLFGLGLMFLALFVTVLLWDSQRLLALGGMTALFFVAALVLGGLARQRLRRGLRLFRSSLDELRRDQEQLRP